MTESYEAVFVDGKYISKDTWYDRDGKPFQPQVHYVVGGAALTRPNLTLLTDAEVTRLETDSSGRTVTGMVVTRGGEREVYEADIVVVSAGAANTNDEEATAMANALRVGDHITSRLS